MKKIASKTSLNHSSKKHSKAFALINAGADEGYKLSTLQESIIYMLAAELKKDDSSKKEFHAISLVELEKGLNKKLSTPELTEAVEELVSRPYTIHEDEGSILSSALISSAEMDPQKHTLILGTSSQIKPYLFNL